MFKKSAIIIVFKSIILNQVLLFTMYNNSFSTDFSTEEQLDSKIENSDTYQLNNNYSSEDIDDECSDSSTAITVTLENETIEFKSTEEYYLSDYFFDEKKWLKATELFQNNKEKKVVSELETIDNQLISLGETEEISTQNTSVSGDGAGNSSPLPPEDAEDYNSKITTRTLKTASDVILSVPAYDWSYGCSPTSGAMLVGYYDRLGYSKIYTGSTNKGCAPMHNNYWPDDPNYTYLHNCPISATGEGLDKRTTRGHIDDYWRSFGNLNSDPYIAENWSQHQGDCVADYMKTSWSEYGNFDGETKYYWEVSNGHLLTCSELSQRDSDMCYGLQQFLLSKGYLSKAYTDCVGNNCTLSSFTLTEYKTEINAQRPVILHFSNGTLGHTVLGVGYGANGIIFLHDTWDQDVHSVSWTGQYKGGYYLVAATVIRLDPNQKGEPCTTNMPLVHIPSLIKLLFLDE